MKKLMRVFVALALMLSVYIVPVFAQEQYAVQLYARVTDAGEVVNKIEIDYGSGKNVSVDTDTFEVVQSKTTQFGVENGSQKDTTRTICKVDSENGKVTLYLKEDEDGTLCWLKEGRNHPGKIEYTIQQKKEIPVIDENGETAIQPDQASYTCDNTIINDETAKFQSVKGNLNYQYYDSPTGDSLIVWFHGNGEGDYQGETGNNVAQMLANKGTVAWASNEAQDIFSGADVMSFQAPDTWYKAQSEGLLEKAYNDIQNVIKTKGIDPKKVYVSGCSAGGYMTTRMIIAYPDLFKAAMINCPALDVASLPNRGGETPTDEELISMKKSKTAIWLVQGETDGTVNTENCSKRLFNILTDGKEITKQEFANGLNSSFTTYETQDNKYKMSLYETTDLADKTDSLGETRKAGKLMFEEDYDHDGKVEQIKYGDHWSWIYTLNNNPKAANGTHIWQWAANYSTKVETTKPVEKPTETINPNKPASSVKTGDDSLIAGMLSIMILSAGGYLAIKKYAK